MDGGSDKAPSPRRGTALDRRQLLRAVGTLAAAFGFPAAGVAQSLTSETHSDADRFRDLTVALTGFSPRDRFLSADFLEAFKTEIGDLARLHAIIRDAPEKQWDAKIAAAGLNPLAESLVTAWYTGMVGEGANQRVITYLDAFVWYAVGYTKPPSQCDTDFGAWGNEPTAGNFGR